MERLTNDDNYAGPIQEKLQSACIRNEGSPQIRVCECVTLALDMQTSPAQRKKMMEGEVIRTILKENETLSARVWYKCKGHLNLDFKIKSR